MKEKSQGYEEVKEGDWEKTPASVKRLVEKQAQVIKELEAQQEELLEKLNRTSKNSSSPPSKDGLDVEKKVGKKGSGKKRVGPIRFGLKLSRINYRESKSLIFDTSSFM